MRAAASSDGAALAYAFHSAAEPIEFVETGFHEEKEVPKQIDYEFTEEFVNVRLALQLAGMPEASKLKHGDLTWKHILHIFVRRARNIVDGIGVIQVAWREPKQMGNLRAGATPA